MSRSGYGRSPATWMAAGTSRGRFVLAAVLSAVIGAACDSDTLYETVPDDVPGPTVEMIAPTAGLEVVAGRAFRLQVLASDTLGITLMEVHLNGAIVDFFQRAYNPPRLAVEVDTLISAPLGAQGPLEVGVRVRNVLNVTNSATTNIKVAVSDTIVPTVSVVADIPQRVEMTDSMRVTVSAADNNGGSGLLSLGFTALIVNAANPSDTLLVPGASRELPAASTDTEVFQLRFPPVEFVDRTRLPQQLTVEVHAWGIDAEGNCAVAVTNSPVRRPCRLIPVAGKQVVVGGETPGQRIETLAVSGRSVPLPAGAWIADALPDTLRERLYLSNLPGYQLEVLNLREYRFEQSVPVGSQPWGLAYNRQKDTLLVANSGGTSISSVYIAGAPDEVVERRFQIPNMAVFEVDFLDHSPVWEPTSGRFVPLSSRPQYLAQDSEGRLVISTRPAQLDPARRGALLIAERKPGFEFPFARLQPIGAGAIIPEGDECRFQSVPVCTLAIGNIDSLVVVGPPGGGGLVELFDSRPGFPSIIVRTGLTTLDQALDSLMKHPDSDIVWARGRWNLDVLSVKDTTYVAASGDHKRVVIGEGGILPGRVAIWDASAAWVSNSISIAQLVTHTYERVLGVGLNHDGSFGVMRGIVGSYYFSADLRLQGSDVEVANTEGGVGAALHHAHPTFNQFANSGQNTLSFVATNSRTIRIFDTVHFKLRGEIALRDNIVGPMRVSAPLASDPCILGVCPVAKIYGVTSAGAVVVVDVLPTQILPPFP